jgi:tetratricopeptide (TPR) repeat protein
VRIVLCACRALMILTLWPCLSKANPEQKLISATKLIVDSLPSNRALAESQLIEVIREDPYLTEAYATLMRFTLWQIASGTLDPAEMQGAAELVEKVQDLAPLRPLGNYLQCELLLAMGQSAQANTLYRNTAAKWPNHQDTKVFEARYWSEIDPVLALDAAVQALAMGEKMDNLSPAIALAITTLSKSQNTNLTKALESFAQVFPDRWIYHKAAVAALQQNEFISAKRLFEKAIDLGNDLESNLQLSIMQYTALNEGQQSIARLEQIEQKFKESAANNADSLALVLCHKALALMKFGSEKRAKEAITEALALSAEMNSVIIPFAEEIMRQGKSPWLVEGLSQVATLNPGFEYVHVTLGNLHTETGNLEQAIHHYGNSIALQPNRDDLYAARAHVHYRARSFDAALRDFSHAADLNPTQASHFYNKACMQAQLGQFSSAVVSLARAFDLNEELRKVALKDSDLIEFWKSPMSAEEMKGQRFSNSSKNDSNVPNLAEGQRESSEPE